MTLRPYQARTVAEVHRLWAAGATRVCVVMPTGAGKTRTALAITAGLTAHWLVHTDALRQQAPGPASTVQSLLGGDTPRADVLIADEAHHYGLSARAWSRVLARYPRVLGLTATPQRHDGTGLRGQFDALVVGASYSELLAGGWLVPARVLRPTEALRGLALEPAEAWRRYAGDGRGFAYFATVSEARRFVAAVDGAALVSGDESGVANAYAIDAFRRRRLQVLASCQMLSEGIDLPEADTCLLASGCAHAGSYLQKVGRVLRPAPGKSVATVIDLPGVSWQYGMPDADREYSLDGRPIREAVPSVRQCPPPCGATYSSELDVCPMCGASQAPLARRRLRVFDLPLVDAREAAAAGQLTARQVEAMRRREAEETRRGKRRARWMAMSDAQRAATWAALLRTNPYRRALMTYRSMFAEMPPRRG